MNPMSDQNIEEKVKEIIADATGRTPNEISEENVLTDDLGVDSLDAVEILMALEEEFEIEDIPDDAAEKMKTVQNVIDYVESHAGKRG